MASVKISSKYQVVIPRSIRETLNLRKGQRVSVISVGGVIEIVPDQDIAEMEGIFPTVSLADVRDESDRS